MLLDAAQKTENIDIRPLSQSLSRAMIRSKCYLPFTSERRGDW